MTYTYNYLNSIKFFYPNYNKYLLSYNLDNDIDSNIDHIIESIFPENIQIIYNNTTVFYILLTNNKENLKELKKINVDYTIENLSYRNISMIARIIKDSTVYNNLTRIKENIE